MKNGRDGYYTLNIKIGKGIETYQVKKLKEVEGKLKVALELNKPLILFWGRIYSDIDTVKDNVLCRA